MKLYDYAPLSDQEREYYRAHDVDFFEKILLTTPGSAEGVEVEIIEDIMPIVIE